MGRTRTRLLAAAALLAAASGIARGQAPTPAAPAATAALSESLAAACRQNAEQFGAFLTTENASTFRALPAEQRAALMQRMVQIESTGRPLLSTDTKGRPLFRCESPGVTVVVRFGDARVQENLAFVPVTASLPGDKPGEPERGAREVQFGLVREGGQWKLLSIGLLMLDLPALARQWGREDFAAREEAAISALREIVRALGTYRRAFGKLPESLTRLGPAPKEGISEEAAGLLDAELAAGSKGGYTFRYRIVPPRPGATGTDQDADDTFELAATPTEYGTTGRRSFFLDSSGTLRGDDKKGAVATVTDPVIESRREPPR